MCSLKHPLKSNHKLNKYTRPSYSILRCFTVGTSPLTHASTSLESSKLNSRKCNWIWPQHVIAISNYRVIQFTTTKLFWWDCLWNFTKKAGHRRARNTRTSFRKKCLMGPASVIKSTLINYRNLSIRKTATVMLIIKSILYLMEEKNCVVPARERHELHLYKKSKK